MKYTLKYRIRLLYWRLFSKWRYKAAMDFKRAFQTMPQETKDLLVKAVLRGTSYENC